MNKELYAQRAWREFLKIDKFLLVQLDGEGKGIQDGASEWQTVYDHIPDEEPFRSGYSLYWTGNEGEFDVGPTVWVDLTGYDCYEHPELCFVFNTGERYAVVEVLECAE